MERARGFAQSLWHPKCLRAAAKSDHRSPHWCTMAPTGSKKKAAAKRSVGADSSRQRVKRGRAAAEEAEAEPTTQSAQEEADGVDQGEAEENAAEEPTSKKARAESSTGQVQKCAMCSRKPSAGPNIALHCDSIRCAFRVTPGSIVRAAIASFERWG